MALTTVLLIAAHTVTREEMYAVLEREPSLKIVAVVMTPDAGSERIGKVPPDVVILDLADAGSADLIHTVHTAWRAASVIVLLPQAESRQVLEALHAGADGIVLRRAASGVIVDAVRAVQAGGNFMCGATSSILIRDYVRRRDGLGAADPLHRLSRRER